MQVRQRRIEGSGQGVRGHGLNDMGLHWDAVEDPILSVVVDAVVAHGDGASNIAPDGALGFRVQGSGLKF